MKFVEHQSYNQAQQLATPKPKDETNFCPKDFSHKNGDARRRSPYNTELTQYALDKSPKCYRVQHTTEEGENILRLAGMGKVR